jgi:CDP-diacylglycerol--glycerol-3-phosphate 3-phosphatidyltransferase
MKQSRKEDKMKAKAKGKGLISHGLIPDWLDKIFLNTVTPLIGLFSFAKINPNWLTFLGFLQNVVASVFIVCEKFLAAGLFIVVAGIFDFIDGKVAAKTGKTTKFGAILDSVLDRYSDIVIYLGLYLYYQRNNFNISALVTIIALVGSVMTSYLKAIGESHGIKFRMGVLRRQERITLICAGLVFSFSHRGITSLLQDISGYFGIDIGTLPVMPLTLIVFFLAIFTNISAVQRFMTLRKISKNESV